MRGCTVIKKARVMQAFSVFFGERAGKMPVIFCASISGFSKLPYSRYFSGHSHC